MQPSILATGLMSMVALGFSHAASGQLVDATDPFSIMKLIQEDGYQARLETDSTGDPMITGRLGSANWSMYFYGCENNRDCNSVSLSSGFDLADGLSAESANAFNYEWRWASVELDEENDPFLRMDINLIYGVSEDNFRDSFDTWRIVLEKFVTFIDW